MRPSSKHFLRELVVPPLLEGSLLLAVAGFGWLIGRPLLFASLGPTAYEQIEQFDRPSAKLYNVIVGHYAAIGAGFLSLYAVSAWSSAHITGAASIPVRRLWASVIAVCFLVFFNLVLKASQPASLSTVLLITSGAFQGPHGAVAILIGVAFLALIGEPVRRWRARQKRNEQLTVTSHPKAA